MKRLMFVFMLVAGLLSQAFSFNDPNLKRGWDHFAENRYSQAERQFKRALDGNYKAEAHLSLVLVGAAINNTALAAEHMYEFYQVAANPYPYLDALWGEWRSNEETATVVRLLTELTESENGKVRAMAHQGLGFHHRRNNKHRQSRAHYAQTGAVLTWQVLGEFENISESGFDKDFGALANPQRTHQFTNKHGAPVQWFDIKAATFSNWIDLEYYFVGINSIIYSQTFCTSPTEQEVQFRLGVAGSVKVWVNDKLMFEESEERDNDLDTYYLYREADAWQQQNPYTNRFK